MPGRVGAAMQGFARALRALPAAVANNGGFDGDRLAADLRARLFGGDADVGLDMATGGLCDVRKAGVFESFRSKECALLYAAEAAEQILRVDSIVSCAPHRQ